MVSRDPTATVVLSGGAQCVQTTSPDHSGLPCQHSPDMAEQSSGIVLPQASESKSVVKDQNNILQNQSPGMQNKSPSLQNQSPGMQNKSPSLQNQSSGVQNQSLSVQEQSPSMQNQIPSMQNQSLSPSLNSSKTEDQSPRMQDQSPRSQEKCPRTPEQNPRTQDQSPKIQDQSPKTQDQNPKTEDPSPRTQDQSPKIQDQSPITQDQSPRTEDQNQRTQDQSPRTQDQSPILSSRQPLLLRSSPRMPLLDKRSGTVDSSEVSAGPTMKSAAAAQENSQVNDEDDEDDEEDSDEEDEDNDLLFPGFVPTVFRCLSQTSRPRYWCLKLITSPWFERVSMGVILLNCVTLGMYKPCEDEVCLSPRCRTLEYFDHFIFGFFAIEMLIKITAMGLYGKETYLAETWNRLDMFIVLAGAIEYAINTENLSLSAIRTIRVLRPLRAINRIPSMRILVMLLLDTLPMLGNVLLLCFFVFFIFGIVGVQLWAGLLRNRCYLSLPENITASPDLAEYYKPRHSKFDFICAIPDEDGETSGMTTCEDIPMFSQVAFEGEHIMCNSSAIPHSNNTYHPGDAECVNWNQYYTQCKPLGDNPFQGSISFDNIGLAWVAIFQVISLEGWVDIMYHVQDSHSFYDWLYFVLLIVIGAFFMINLCLVVIATQFSETKKRETERMLQERKRYHSSSTLASISEPGGCYNEIIKYIAHLARKAKRKIKRFCKQTQGRRQRRVTPEKAISLRRKKKPITTPQYIFSSQCVISNNCTTLDTSPMAPRASPEVSDIDPLSSPRRPNVLMVDNSANHSEDSSSPKCKGDNPEIIYSPNGCPKQQQSSGLVLISGPKQQSPHQNIFCTSNGGNGNHLELKAPKGLSIHGAQLKILPGSNCEDKSKSPFTGNLWVPSHFGVNASAGQRSVTMPLIPAQRSDLASGQEGASDTDSDSDQSSVDWEDEDLDNKTKSPGVFSRFQSMIKRLVEHNMFTKGILLAIIINTLSMGIEYHNQPDALTLVLEYSNVFFTGLFVLEMLLKIIAEGPFGYIKNGFNIFDGFIVVLSLVELVQGGAGGLSVLRTFRLLRVLKLVRFMPVLRSQLVIMLRTMDNVATFCALLILFIFIFSVLGMHLFGGKFCQHPVENRPCTCNERDDPEIVCKCERKNFDTLLWSLVTVFQILTQEDWNEVLYNGMSKTSDWAALYFIALMTFGNYVLFNLLVAILVEGFSSEGQGNTEELDKKKKNCDKEKPSNELTKGEDLKKIKDINKLEDKELLAKICKCKLSGDCTAQTGDIKNNKEKEKILLGLPPNRPCIKAGKMKLSLDSQGGNSREPLTPPIITHTAATPMTTPQGSPNEMSLNNKEIKNNLNIGQLFNMSTLSVDTVDKSSTLSIPYGIQKMSPKVQHGASQKSCLSWLNRFRSKEDCRVPGGSEERERVDGKPKVMANSLSPSSCNNYSDCNGHAPLNNQRSLSPQNSIQSYRAINSRNSVQAEQTFLPNHTQIIDVYQNSFINPHCQISRKNSLNLSRQNSINSQRTLSPQNSFGSTKEEFKHNNLSAKTWVSDSKMSSEFPTKDSEEKQHKEDEEEDDDDDYAPPLCPWKWCPEPTGVFHKRRKYAVFVFAPENRMRKACAWLIEQKWFDYGVLFFIALNCITLAMERPDIPKKSIERMFLSLSNYVFTVIFAFEMVVKVTAKGLFLGKTTYLKSGWNVMDGFLVIISLVDVIVSMSASKSTRIFGILRVFRLLRTLRPLRVISRAPGLKLVVQTLLSSLRPIGNIVLICCTFFIIFGILGVQLFKGTFYYCEGGDVSDVINKTDCQNKGPPYRWVNQKYNFDDLGQALMALFVLASKDGWVNIMYTGLDAVGVNQQPKVNYNEWRLLYFISFLLLVGFFVLNMFVGVVVENFHKCRESQEKEEKARRAAKRAKKMERKRRKLREPPYWSSYSKPRLFMHTVISSKYFDLAIAGVIGLNVITMALEYYLMPKTLKHALKIFNFFFTSVFILEAGVKGAALGFTRYMKDRWNQLDATIVVLSIVGIILEEMESGVIPINPTIIRVMRVLRIARVLKLLKMAKGIRALLDTVMQALPQVGNLGLLFFLLFFIFAALGVELFGRLECSEIYVCEGLSKHANFQNFGMAFLTLFRVATGDNWNGIMKDTLREGCELEEHCPSNNCCVSPFIAPVFFVIFVLMAQFVLVNVVVAVLMKHLEDGKENFEEDEEDEEQLAEEAALMATSFQNQESQLQREVMKKVPIKDVKKDTEPVVNVATKVEHVEEKHEKTPQKETNDAVLKKPLSTTHLEPPHKMICKQTSLPPDFTFSVTPPRLQSVDANHFNLKNVDKSINSQKRGQLKLPLIRIDAESGPDDTDVQMSIELDLNSHEFSISPAQQISGRINSPTYCCNPGLQGSPSRRFLKRQDAVSNNSSPSVSPISLSPNDHRNVFLPLEHPPPSLHIKSKQIPSYRFAHSNPRIDRTRLSVDWGQERAPPVLRRSIPDVGAKPLHSSPCSASYPLAMDPNPMYLRKKAPQLVYRSKSLKLENNECFNLNKNTSQSEPLDDYNKVNINMFDPYPRKNNKLGAKKHINSLFSPRGEDCLQNNNDLYNDPSSISVHCVSEDCTTSQMCRVCFDLGKMPQHGQEDDYGTFNVFEIAQLLLGSNHPENVGREECVPYFADSEIHYVYPFECTETLNLIFTYPAEHYYT